MVLNAAKRQLPKGCKSISGHFSIDQANMLNRLIRPDVNLASDPAQKFICNEMQHFAVFWAIRAL